MKKKNAWIEILRFFFAFNVLKCHDYFFSLNGYIGGGKLSVEFFFMVSGFLFVSVLDKYKNSKFFEGIWDFLKNKGKRLGIGFLICYLCCMARFFIVTPIDEHFVYNLFHTNDHLWTYYLWYVVDMIEVMLAFIIIRILIKKDKAFYIVLGIMTLVCSILRCFESLYSQGYIRAISSMGIGIFLKLIPKTNLKQKHYYMMFIPSLIIMLLLVILKVDRYHELGLYYLVYPVVIYSAFNIECNNKVFLYLGGLSFGLYIYQSVAALIRDLGFGNMYIYLLIIVSITVLDDLIKRYRRKKKMNVQSA